MEVAKSLTQTSSGRRARSRKTMREDKFSNYLVFGFASTMCLASFLLCYVFVLLSLWPLLHSSYSSLSREDSSFTGDHRIHVPPSLKQAHLPGQEKLSKMAGAVKSRVQQLRRGRGVTDAQLLEQAKREFDEKRRLRMEQENALVQKNNLSKIVGQAPNDKRSGFIVLGMHRSGTSMLSGLLVTGFGYNVGKSSDLVGANFDNEKGFFERVDIILQNDAWFVNQKMHWAANVINYDWQKALSDKEDGSVAFELGRTGLAWLEDSSHVPWLQKDPRMCITLKTWLKLLKTEPAIVFTYRHPLEVAKSLRKREPGMTIEQGLRLWIVYNMRAIQNSKGLCMVKSSNTKIFSNPLEEVKRIQEELSHKCGVVDPPRIITQEDVDKFVDPNLQHENKRQVNQEDERKLLFNYNDGDCKVFDYVSELEDGDPAKQREVQLYKWAMKIYCDLESGTAHEDGYEWPLG